MKKVVITGGGTGGHAFPAVAIAEELLRRRFEILYVGSHRGFEAKLVPERGIRYVAVQSGAVKNQSFFTIVKTAFRLAKAIYFCLRLFLKEKPDAVIGVGGYVSVPASLAAFLLRIPLYLQEQNTSVGLANRFLGKLSKKIFLGFPQALDYFSPSRCIVTGNPIRGEFFEKSPIAFSPAGQHLLILGGSQGSQAINDAVLTLLPRLKEKYPNSTLLHQTGEKDFERVQKAYLEFNFSGYEATAFLKNILKAYQKANLIIARSGALTVSELIQVGRPAIFVPYPRRGQNDQVTNAYYVENAKAGRVVQQGQNFVERLWNTIEEVFQIPVLEKMEAAFSQLRRPSAIASIADRLQEDLAG